MKAGRFVFGRWVEDDLRRIRDHIAKDNPEAARVLMRRLVSVFPLLARRPDLGHCREGLASPERDSGRLVRIWSSMLAGPLRWKFSRSFMERAMCRCF